MRFFIVDQSGEERRAIDLREWSYAYGEIASMNDDYPGADATYKGNKWVVIRDPDTYGYYLAVEEKTRLKAKELTAHIHAVLLNTYPPNPEDQEDESDAA